MFATNFGVENQPCSPVINQYTLIKGSATDLLGMLEARECRPVALERRRAWGTAGAAGRMGSPPQPPPRWGCSIDGGPLAQGSAAHWLKKHYHLALGTVPSAMDPCSGSLRASPREGARCGRSSHSDARPTPQGPCLHQGYFLISKSFCSVPMVLP